MNRKARSRHFHPGYYKNSMIFRMLPTTILLPVVVIAFTSFQGYNISKALENSLKVLFELPQAGITWFFILAGNALIYSFLNPVFEVWTAFRTDQPITMTQRNRAMGRFNRLSKRLTVLTILAFLFGGAYDLISSEGLDIIRSLPGIYHMTESVATGFLTATMMNMGLENILFPIKRVVMQIPPEKKQCYRSYYKRLIITMMALMCFLYFQIFFSAAEFIVLGAQIGEGLRLDEIAKGYLTIVGRYHPQMKSFLQVFEIRFIFFTLISIRLLAMLKKSLKNPIDTVRDRLMGLTSQEGHSKRRIAIVNNDEFTEIYNEINTLILQQQGELEQNRIRLHTLIDHAADPILSFDQAGTIFMVNPSAEEYFEWTREELQGHSLRCLISDKPLPLDTCNDEDHNYVQGLLKEYQGLKRFQGVTKNGQRRSFEANISQSDTPDGPIYTAILRDIAAQLEMEENLKSSRDSAQRANQLKSEFLANMSHELRTPLNAVLGFTQLLSNDKSLNQGQLKKIQIISRSGEHLLGLINDILDISKIEAGKLELHPASFALQPFMEDIGEMFELRCKKKGLILDMEYLGDLPEVVQGDLGKLRQILINLLGNAVKFTDEGGISVVVGQDQGKIRFAISDTGKGIPEEDQQSIIQPFTQSSNIDNEGGTGLGLAISSRYVEMMGGKLEIQSALGHGSTFSFAIDLPTGEVLEQEQGLKGEVLGIKGDLNPKALIVDDKENNRLVLKEMLERVGFITMEGVDGEQAISRYREFNPDLIFMDIRMPKMDGYQAVEALRSQSVQIPIIALTASAFKHDEEKIISSGFDGFLAKPFKQSSLFSLIEKKSSLEFRYQEEIKTIKNVDINQLDRESLRELQNSSYFKTLEDHLMINDFLAIKEMALKMEEEQELMQIAGVLSVLADDFDEENLNKLLNMAREEL